MLAGMEPIEESMRSSGQYGPRVEVPADADAQTRMLAFIGRDPGGQRRASVKQCSGDDARRPAREPP